MSPEVRVPHVLQNHYVLAVQDIRRSADYYVSVLDFAVAAEHPGWIFVAKDNCMIMLGECADEVPAGELGNHSYFAYLRVDDADAYFARLRDRGAEFISTIQSKPWAMREFGIRTPDGHRIMIGHVIGGGA